MLSSAQRNGHLTGLVPHLIPEGITHLQYANDTIFLELTDNGIRVIKAILMCYKTMLGMKMNYEKSDVFVMGVEVEEQTRVANLVNSKTAPITYQILGAPNEQC
jgi:hypothetical protein